MSTPKFQAQDSVMKVARNECITRSGRYQKVTEELKIKGHRYGTITDFIIKKDRRGRAYFYYYVIWDDSKTNSLHCQNMLRPAEENT